MENSYFAVEAFVNEAYGLCRRLGADWLTLREGWWADSRVERDHPAVRPRCRRYGGRCLPKDLDAISAVAQILGQPMPLLSATRAAGEWRRSRSEPDRATGDG